MSLDLDSLASEWQADVIDELELDDDTICDADLRRERWANLPDPEGTLPLTRDERQALETRNTELCELCTALNVDESPAGLRSFCETLIAESEFADYARQFAEDVGAVEDFARWPCTHINWELAANDLRADYTTIDFDEITYLVRLS